MMHPRSFVHRLPSLLAFGLFAAGFPAAPASAASATVDPAIAPYEPRSVQPAKDAGYVLPDGSLQIVEYSEMEGVVTALDALFVKSHPGIKFKTGTADNLGVIYCLTFDATAVAPLAWEVPGGLAYASYVHGEPFGIRIAHASLNPDAKVSPLAVIVNKSNPLKSLKADQVAHIFTEGGHKRDIDHWNQVGLDAPWATRQIHPCGLPWTDQYKTEDTGYPDLFARMMGGNQPVWDYDSSSSYAAVVRKVAEDPEAIGIAALNRVTADVRVVPVASGWGAPSQGSAEDIVSGRYPYNRYIYIYIRRGSGKPLDPFIAEYLRLALSREGQEAIAAEGHGYLPLSLDETRAELSKLQ
jgi:phosphate transport system substrate-binding protein